MNSGNRFCNPSRSGRWFRAGLLHWLMLKRSWQQLVAHWALHFPMVLPQVQCVLHCPYSHAAFMRRLAAGIAMIASNIAALHCESCVL